MSVFPTLSKGQDSRYYTTSGEDPTARSEIEGGYVFTRPRYTRRPRRRWTTGFTDLTNADKLTLETFIEDMKVGSTAFSWVDPVDNEVYQVRFASRPEFVYAGFGDTHHWNVPTIELEEV